MIKIAIADDQPIVRQGIVQLIGLNDGFDVTIEASDGQEAFQKLRSASVDLIITDLQMPVMNGIDLITALRKAGIETPILVLTTFDDNELLIAAIKAGCNGFLLKDITVEKLHDAIESVAAGGYLIEPQTTAVSPALDTETQTLTESITTQEKQILRLAAAGFSNKEIADCMQLSGGTVKNYMSRILEKTHSRDRTQAVVKAINWKVI